MKSDKLFRAALVIVFVIINLISSEALPDTLTIRDSEHADLYDNNTYDSIIILDGSANIYGGNFTINNIMGSFNVYGGSTASMTDSLGTVRIYKGINGYAGVFHGSSLYMYGGMLGGLEEMRGGEVYIYGGVIDSINGYDVGKFLLYGGSVNSVNISTFERLYMLGDGIINDLRLVNSFLEMSDGIIGNINVDGSNAIIKGGQIDTINLLSGSSADIYGGIIDNLIYPAGPWELSYARYNLYGHDWKYIFEGETPVRLEGFSLDGSPLNISLGDTTDLSYKIVLHNVIPEPSTMLLLGSGLIGLAGYGRKKFFKK